MAGILLALALAMPVPPMAGTGQPVALKAQVELRTAELRVGDLVELRGVALPERIAAMVVMRMPRGDAAFDMPAERAAALVRRRVPALHPVVVPGSVVRIHAAKAAGEPRAARGCFAAANAIAPGTTLSAGDVTEAPCRAEVGVRLQYGRAGLVVAREAVPAGGYLGRLAALPERTVGKGATLTLRSTSGPVTVERAVVALQPARSGGKLFVRDASGSVFAAPLALSPGNATQ